MGHPVLNTLIELSLFLSGADRQTEKRGKVRTEQAQKKRCRKGVKSEVPEDSG